MDSRVEKSPKSNPSTDVEARLVAPLYTYVGSLLPSHIACLLLCIPFLILVGGVGSRCLVVASAVIFALRLHLLHRIRRLPACPAPEDLLRWLSRYQMIGLVWCVISAALCGICIAIGNDFLRASAFMVVVGTTATIAVRNANAPRFAALQIIIWTLPLAAIVPRLAARIEYGGSIAIVLVAIYFVALQSILVRGYRNILAMIEADLTRDNARQALVESETALSAIFNNAAAGIMEIDLTKMR